MNKIRIVSIGFLLTLGIALGNVYGQSDKPPGCCKSPLPVINPVGPTESGGTRIAVSADASQLLGMTRSQFVDRLAQVFFPGRAVDLVFHTISMRLVENPETEFRSGQFLEPGGDALVAVEEKRFYQVSRQEVASEDIDVLREVYLTDGHVFLKVSFVDNLND